MNPVRQVQILGEAFHFILMPLRKAGIHVGQIGFFSLGMTTSQEDKLCCLKIDFVLHLVPVVNGLGKRILKEKVSVKESH